MISIRLYLRLSAAAALLAGIVAVAGCSGPDAGATTTTISQTTTTASHPVSTSTTTHTTQP
jgi:hypothetical protein